MSQKDERHLYRLCRCDAETEDMLLAELRMTEEIAERLNDRVQKNAPDAQWLRIDCDSSRSSSRNPRPTKNIHG